MRRLLLIRHGRTDWNVTGRLNSFTEVPLDAVGQRQVLQMGEHVRRLYPTFRLMASPALRARQTAEAIAHDLNQPLVAVASYTEAAVRMLRGGNPDPERLMRALEGSAQQAQRAGLDPDSLLGQTLDALIGEQHLARVDVEHRRPVHLPAAERTGLVAFGLHYPWSQGLQVRSLDGQTTLPPLEPPVSANPTHRRVRLPPDSLPEARSWMHPRSCNWDAIACTLHAFSPVSKHQRS